MYGKENATESDTPFYPPPSPISLISAASLPQGRLAAWPENMSPIPVIMSPLLWSCGTMWQSHTHCPLPRVHTQPAGEQRVCIAG